MQSLVQSFGESPANKICYNVGCLLDIFTGVEVMGARGESIWNGGVGLLTGVVGRANRFKSALIDYFMMSMLDQVMESMIRLDRVKPTANYYDTEINMSENRKGHLASFFPTLKEQDLFAEKLITVSDKSTTPGEKWYEYYRAFVAMKINNRKHLMVETPFLERDRKTQMQTMIPTVSCIDSLTAFDVTATQELSNDNEIGSSGGRTLFMQQGLVKKRLMTEMPTNAGSAQQYTMFTAHVTDKLTLASGPMTPPPAKQLESMKTTDQIKGVTNDFLFLVTNVFICLSVKPLLNKGDECSEYPRNELDRERFEKDLMLIQVGHLRGKNGPSSWVMPIIVSQRDGVQRELSELNWLRTEREYANMHPSGNKSSWTMAVYPEVSMTRKNVRAKIAEDSKLRRAIGICADLEQLRCRFPDRINYYPTAQELYEKLKEQGYDWDMLLQTRSNWMLDQYINPVMYLSTHCMVRMYHGLYHPYWLQLDKKTLTPEFQAVVKKYGKAEAAAPLDLASFGKAA